MLTAADRPSWRPALRPASPVRGGFLECGRRGGMFWLSGSVERTARQLSVERRSMADHGRTLNLHRVQAMAYQVKVRGRKSGVTNFLVQLRAIDENGREIIGLGE